MKSRFESSSGVVTRGGFMRLVGSLAVVLGLFSYWLAVVDPAEAVVDIKKVPGQPLPSGTTEDTFGPTKPVPPSSGGKTAGTHSSGSSGGGTSISSDGGGHLPGTPYGPGNSDSGNTNGSGNNRYLADAWSGTSKSPWDTNKDGYVSQEECYKNTRTRPTNYCIDNFPSDDDIKELKAKKNQYTDTNGCTVEKRPSLRSCISTKDLSQGVVTSDGQPQTFKATLSDDTSVVFDLRDLKNGKIYSWTTAPSGNLYRGGWDAGFKCSRVVPLPAPGPAPPVGTCYISKLVSPDGKFQRLIILGRDSYGKPKSFGVDLFDCPNADNLPFPEPDTLVFVKTLLRDCHVYV